VIDSSNTAFVLEFVHNGEIWPAEGVRRTEMAVSVEPPRGERMIQGGENGTNRAGSAGTTNPCSLQGTAEIPGKRESSEPPTGSVAFPVPVGKFAMVDSLSP
jgi:hypothetical protein